MTQRSPQATSTSQSASAPLKWTVIKSKPGLHARNLHQGRYDFSVLVKVLPELKAHIVTTPKGESSIDFANPQSVILLNKALLKHYYGVTEWQIPSGFLCPPIPGRADYIHRLADVLSSECKGLKHGLINALDIGVGANCIYPIVGVRAYGWRYVGSDIDPISVENAQRIVERNSRLKGQIECRLQSDRTSMFANVIRPGEFYDVTTCNPPFHRSEQEAAQGSERKQRNLAANKVKRRGTSATEAKNTTLNFGGQKAELWCPGGEATFVKQMATESRLYAQQVAWFSTLLSKKENVRWLKKQLQSVGAVEAKVVEMQQGQKVSRFVAWTFKTPEQRHQWFKYKC